MFDLRQAWFREYHSDGPGWTSEARFLRAIDDARGLDSLPLPQQMDPGGEAPQAGYGLVTGAGALPVELGPAPDLESHASLGFAGPPVLVDFSEQELPEGVDVKVALRSDVGREIDLATVRMFRFDEETDSWVLVPRSGVGHDLSYAWVRAHRPGRFVPIGLPLAPALSFAVGALRRLRSDGDDANWGATVDALAGLLEAEGLLNTDDHEGSGPRPGAVLGVGELRERLSGLDRRQRLPEFQILDDADQVSALSPPTATLVRPRAADRRQGRRPGTPWTSVGPSNVNGRIKSLAIHPTDPNVLWAGAANGGVWKTTNAGETWFPTMFQQFAMTIGALAVSASDPSVLYAATGEDTPGWGPRWPGTGVYKSVDGGMTWPQLANIPSKGCTRVLIDPTNSDRVFVGGESGLHLSTNGGVLWTDVRTDHVCDALMDPANPNRIFAAVWNSGVYRSTDAGSHWETLSEGLPTGWSAGWIKLAMGVRGGAAGTNFLVAKMGVDSGDIYLSSNGGDDWHSPASGVETADYTEWTNTVAVDPNDHRRILAGGIGLSLALSQAGPFTAVTGTHADHQAIVYSPDDSNTVYAATDGGVYRSTDGGSTWSLRSSQLIATQLYSIGVSQTDEFRLGGATQDQGVIQAGTGSNWTDTSAGNEGGFFVVDPNEAQNVYATPWSANLRRSTDGGATWTTILNGDILAGAVPVNDLAVMPGNSQLLICLKGSEVLSSKNQGDDWVVLSKLSGVGRRVVLRFDGTGYAVTSGGRVYFSATAFGADSWTEPYVPADKPPFGMISSVAVSRSDFRRLYISYAGFGVPHVWRSTDGGAHWINASGTGRSALPDIPVSDVVLNPRNSDVVYAATDIGVFQTRDGGLSWENFSQGMPRTVVTMRLFASEWGEDPAPMGPALQAARCCRAATDKSAGEGIREHRPPSVPQFRGGRCRYQSPLQRGGPTMLALRERTNQLYASTMGEGGI